MELAQRFPNFQIELEKKLAVIDLSGVRPRLLLHSCCGPCSSYVLEYLTRHFEVSLFYYNPNIWPEAEYIKRLSEQDRLLREAPFAQNVRRLPAEYDPEAFEAISEGLKGEKEGGARCAECFRLRLERTARAAKEGAFDYFTTTLTVSPHKNSRLLNKIGQETGEKFGVEFLCSDFKKAKGFDRSLELSEEYALYRQEYCGCRYSKGRPEETGRG